MALFDQLFHDIAANPWLYDPAGAVLLFAGILQFLLQRRGAGAHRRALLFGVGSVALLATGVAVAFGYSFIRLLRGGAPSFDVVWICSALAAGALAAWLWFLFVRLLRHR